MSKLWGARFKGKTDKLADKFTFSIAYDYRLAKYDVVGSIAHAQMLGHQRIIPKSDAQKIIAGLTKIRSQIEAGKFKFDPKAEDVHTNIQTALKALIGRSADKLHTARSRNDQVVLDVKLYCLDEIDQIIAAAASLQKAIVIFARTNQGIIIPAYTHLQSAQVVLLAHHMLAYVEMLERDKGRLQDCLKRLDSMPLGSCALSGTSLKINRNYVAKLLGFAGVAQNSMDAVSDRDFIIEAVSACAITAVHLSRISEDLILWATREFNFVDIDWAFCTGSSIMPHKKNPDVLELIRGESATLIGNLNKLLVLLKGLPLTYNPDLQLDKPPVFESVEKSELMLELIAKLFGSLEIKKEIIDTKTDKESFFCVDIMEYLIKKGVSYREAHDTVGKMVKDCLDEGISLADLSGEDLRKFSKHFSEDVKNLLNPKTSVKIKKSFGSTNQRIF